MSQSLRVGILLTLGAVAIVTAARQGMERRRSERARAIAEQDAALNAAVEDAARSLVADDPDAPGIAGPANPDASILYSQLPAPERDSARIALTLDARTAGSYLLELLDTHGGWNYRWPDRRGEPMRVWVQEPATAAFDRAWTADVREAFSDWGDLGLPLTFTFTVDSARAEVHVTWVDRFTERMTGRTRWRYDQHGWIVGGNIQLALHLPDGRRVTRAGVRAIARHEVGHLIGLDHTADTTSVMSAQVFVTELSEADRRTARLVYELPPGKLR